MMACSIVDIPQELLQRIVLHSVLDSSDLGVPSELHNCLLTCRHFHDVLSPLCAGELYWTIFSQKFDSRAPTLRLSPKSVRENAPLELRRRFSALKIFKDLDFDNPSLPEALLIAYIMLEESDRCQKNLAQLLRVGLPSFLNLFVSRRLYEGAGDNGGWPVLNETNSLVIALSWTLATQSSITSEDRTTSDHIRNLLRPIVFAASRYSIFFAPEDLFTIDKNVGTNEGSPSIAPPCLEIVYFGALKKRAYSPSAPLSASLLYFARTKTQDEAILAGYDGLSIEHYEHYYHHCRTKFVDFSAHGIQSSGFSSLPSSILCGPVRYKLGTLSGLWQGSQMIPYISENENRTSATTKDTFNVECECRTPVYFRIEEHYCCDEQKVVPIDDKTNGMKNAWLPPGLTTDSTAEGMKFSDQTGTFHSTYRTYRDGQPLFKLEQVIDVIITGETPDQYIRWGGGSMILGRVRMQDGLVVLTKYLPTQHDSNCSAMTQVFRGYVTDSQNLVGRIKGSTASHEGIFSMSKANNSSQSDRLARTLPI